MSTTQTDNKESFCKKLFKISFWARLLNGIFILLLSFFIYQNYTLRESINNLKAEVSILKGNDLAPTQFNHIEYKVDKLTEDKDFFRSLYADNSSWFIGLVSLVVVVAVGFSIYSNRSDLKEYKKNTKKKIKLLQEGIDTNFRNIRIDLYGITAHSFLERALTIRNEQKGKEEKMRDYTYVLVYYAKHLTYAILSPEDCTTYINETFQEMLDLISKHPESKIQVDKVIPEVRNLKKFNNPSINEIVDEIIKALDDRNVQK